MFKINNRNQWFICAFAGLILSVLAACNDVFEKNITDEVPVVILPKNKDSIAENPVHVKWEAVDGATKYRIEIVSPNFNNIADYVIDSIVVATDFYVALDTNQYALRITALNAGYTSQPSAIKSFFVGVAPSADSEVKLTSPFNFAYFNATNFDRVFDWEPVANLKSFTFELHKDSDFSGDLLFNKAQLETSQLTLESTIVLSEGDYNWGVKSFLLNNSESNFAKRIFYIDTTSPAKVTLQTPINNALVTAGDITFNWNIPNDPGKVHAPITYLLEVATDNLFTTIVKTQSTTSNSFTIEDLTTGTYYWRVTPTDAATNSGASSTVNKLILTL